MGGYNEYHEWEQKNHFAHACDNRSLPARIWDTVKTWLWFFFLFIVVPLLILFCIDASATDEVRMKAACANMSPYEVLDYLAENELDWDEIAEYAAEEMGDGTLRRYIKDQYD